MRKCYYEKDYQRKLQRVTTTSAGRVFALVAGMKLYLQLTVIQHALQLTPLHCTEVG